MGAVLVPSISETSVFPVTRVLPTPLSAQENPLGRVTASTEDGVVGDRDVMRRCGCAARQELDCVRMIAGGRLEVVDGVATDHHIAHLREDHTSRFDIVDVVAGDGDAGGGVDPEGRSKLLEL